MAGELITDNGNIILAAHKMEAYIPIELFDEDRSTTDVTHAAVASTYGEGFRVIAIFSVRIAKTDKDDISKMPLKTYNYPQLIETYPSSSYDAELTLPYRDNVSSLIHEPTFQSIIEPGLFPML